MWDTYSQVAALATSLTHDGTRWFFVTADYAFGHALQSDATAIVRARGGQVVGSVLHPFPGTSDFSSYLLQAQASGAGLIGLANAGADVQTAIKQAREFGLGGDGSGQQLAAFVVFAPDVQSLGLDVARGITVTEGFFYGLDERTRAWAARFMAAYGHGLPSQIHAGVYSATLHYLRAVAAAHTTDTAAVIRAMHGLPIQDDVVRNATLRPDGRMVHDYYVFRVKAPVASSGPNDIYDLVATIPGDQAFRPLSASACPAIADAAK
jgi:branched-chain amino acid transport system substrate-binding protein